MALSKNMDFFGFNTDVYAKIGGVLTKETSSDSDGKVYTSELQIDWYTNSTKEHHFKQDVKKIDGLRESDLTFPTFYEKLQATTEFEGFLNA